MYIFSPLPRCLLPAAAADVCFCIEKRLQYQCRAVAPTGVYTAPFAPKKERWFVLWCTAHPDDDADYYIGERLKLERETENSGV